MQELSGATKKLITRYQAVKKQEIEPVNTATIHVDEFASNVAAFYEKIRMIVDWKEEHLIKRTAITRRLKRRFIGSDINNLNSSESIAEPLILELIRAGHFPNDKIEESKIGVIKNILDKYILILKNSPQKETPKEKMQFYNWLMEITACEIEENLAPLRKENALIDYMFEMMKERISVSDKFKKKNQISPEEKNIQIYIAVQQSLFKLDNPLISYNLIKYLYPQWTRPSENYLTYFTNNIYNIWHQVEQKLSHPLGKKFYTICEKYDTPYLLLGDVLAKTDISKTITPEELESSIKDAYKLRLSTLGQRIYRAAFYSTLSSLLTNAFSVFVIEIPLALWIYGQFSSSPYLTISVDILGPTMLMFLMVGTIRPPSKKNLNTVILETMKIVYEKENRDVYEIKPNRKMGVITASIISIIYLATTVLSFGAILYIFDKARFPITSAIINIVLITIISFAGIAIRKKGQELTIEEKKSGIFGFLFDILSLPVASVGRWLSNKWKKYNAIAAFFNAIIDTPFTIFVEFLEQWRYFIKERKEEIR